MGYDLHSTEMYTESSPEFQSSYIRDLGDRIRSQGGERPWRFVLEPANLDGFMTVHKIVGHELDWLRRRFIFVTPNLLAGSNLSTALAVLCRVVRRCQSVSHHA